MRICYLAPADSIHSLRWIRFFVQQGHEVLWISLAKGLADVHTIKHKMSYHEIGQDELGTMHPIKKLIVDFRMYTEAKRLIEKFKPDITHVHSCGTYGLLAALIGTHPCIFTPWGSDILLGSALKKSIVKWSLKAADHFTIDGENTRASLIQAGIPENKITFIRFGTDVDRFTPRNTTHTQGNHSDALKILSIRSHEPTYDIPTLLKAAQILKNRKLHFELIIAGDGTLRHELESRAVALGIGGITHFIGKVNADDLPKLFQQADIYVSTSLSDSGLASSTAEAMASGLPVVISDSSDNHDWVQNGKGGYLFPCRDYEELARYLEKLITMSAETRMQMATYNREQIVTRNNFVVEMKKTEDLYAKLCATLTSKEPPNS